MSDVVIVEAVRTPVGRRDGKLSALQPVELGALVLKEVVRRAGISPEDVDDVVMGCVTQTGEQGANIGRLSTLMAGFPVEVPAVSVNRMCGSSQQALHFASQAIAAGDMDVVIAAGVESMSRVPIGSDMPQAFPSDFPFRLVPQGISAEMMAEKWNISRSALDRFSFESHQKAAAATRAGYFEAEILPVEVTLSEGDCEMMTVDEGIRFEPDLEKMAALQPVFKEDGVITAGNASQISDGAAAVLLMNADRVEDLELRARARIVARTVVGSDPVLMLSGPIPATRKVLAKAGLAVEDVDAFEVNEAFASVPLAWAQEIQPPLERVNPNGGAIALGHPLGATGARLMVTLLHHLERTGGRFGLQTMCIGHGMATATIIERLDEAS
ncbi:MAG: thiolase family protein [Anaerolineae bacterium]